MAIQPIDMQVMIHKTTEVNKTNNEFQKTNEQQLMFADQMQKQVEHNTQHVVNTNKSEEETIEDGKGGNKGQYKKGRKRKEEKKENLKKNNGSSSMFDVSI